MAPLRGYLKTASMSAAGHVGDSPLFAADCLLRLLRVALLLSLWRVLMAGRGEVGGMSLPTLLTYTLAAEAFAQQLQPRTDLEVALYDGSIVQRFLRPASLVGQFAAETAGRWGFGFAVFSVPLLLLAPMLGVNPLPADPLSGALFVPSLALGVSIGLALDFIYGAILVVLGSNAYVFRRMQAAIAVLLSGAMLPLAAYPWGLGSAFGWLPFAATASAPLRIYTGTGPALLLLATQAGWCAALWMLAHWMWDRNRERLVCYGG